MKKRVISMLLVATMVMSALVGCGAKEEAPAEAPAAEEEVAEEAEAVAPEDMPTISYYLPCDPQEDMEMVEAKLNELTMEKIGVKVNLEFIDWAAWTEKTQLMHASKEKVDVMSGYQMGSAKDVVENGIALDLTELLETTGASLKDSMPEYMWEAAKVDGQIYFVPNYQIEGVGPCMAVRKDLVEKYNFDVDSVETVLDLEPFWQQIKENEPDLYPFKLAGNVNFIFAGDAAERTGLENPKFSVVSYVPAYWDDIKAGDTANFALDLTKECAKIAYEVAQKGYLRPDIAAVDNATQTADWKAGKYASATITTYKPGIETEEKNNTGYDWIMIPFDKAYVSETWPLATCTFIGAYTEYPEESMKFIELINTDKEVYNLICFGIEGEHYEWADADHIQVISDGGYVPNFAWAVGNQFNAYVQVGQDVDVWEKTIELNNNSVVSPYMGIIWDTSEITLENAQLKKIFEQYVNGMMNKGIADPDTYWDDMLKEIEAAGYKEAQECVQSQIDAFLAAK